MRYSDWPDGPTGYAGDCPGPASDPPEGSDPDPLCSECGCWLDTLRFEPLCRGCALTAPHDAGDHDLY